MVEMGLYGQIKQKRAAGGFFRMARGGLFLTVAALGLLLDGGAAEARLMKLDYFVLDNGLRVAVAENRKAPVVLQMLYYKTGSVNDPKGKGGTAHLLEHLMFRGTKRVPGQAFNRLTEEHGASGNAYTTYDQTAYYEFSDIAKLELMMALEADRMQGLDISDEAFAAERDIVLQERRQRFETNPVPLFYETLSKLLWQDHPLANPVSGSPSEIRSLTKSDVEDFYRRYYRPDNALLVLAGDISAAEAKDLAQKYFGKLANPAMTIPTPTLEKGRASEVETLMRIEGVQQPRYADSFRMDAGVFSKKDIQALGMLAEYLTGDDSAPLYDELVYRGKQLLGIDVGFSYNPELGGSFGIYATPAPEWLAANGRSTRPAGAIKELIGKALEKAIADLSPEKLDKIKNRVVSDAVYLQENPRSSANFAGDMLLSGYTAEEIADYDEAIRAVTLDDVIAAWKKVTASGGRVTGFLCGREKAEGAAAGNTQGGSNAD